MFMPDGANQSEAPSGVADITPAEPETTSADIALMQRVLAAASRNVNLIPSDFMAYIVDFIQTSRLQIPIGQVPGFKVFTYTQVRRASGLGATNSGSFAAMPMDTADVDGLLAYDAGSPSKLTMRAAGFYVAFGSVAIAGQSGSGNVQAEIQRLNSGGVLQETIGVNSSSQLNGTASVASGMIASAGDYIQLLFQSGATGNAGSLTGRFSLVKLPG
jgi:hypothetical protein